MNLAERLTRSRLPVAPLVSVILEDMPAVCVGDDSPRLFPRGQGVIVDVKCVMLRLYVCSRNL